MNDFLKIGRSQVEAREAEGLACMLNMWRTDSIPVLHSFLNVTRSNLPSRNLGVCPEHSQLLPPPVPSPQSKIVLCRYGEKKIKDLNRRSHQPQHFHKSNPNPEASPNSKHVMVVRNERSRCWFGEQIPLYQNARWKAAAS